MKKISQDILIECFNKSIYSELMDYQNIKVMENQNKSIRPISEIAAEIKKVWKNVYFGAVPYLDAMLSLNSINDKYMFDSAADIVRYFLSNASTWRGEDARRIKKELKDLLKNE